MSGSISPVLAQPIGINVAGALQGWQNLAQSQAQTAVTQQQAQGAAIQNALAGLNLRLRSAFLAPFLGGGAGAQSGAVPAMAAAPGGSVVPPQQQPASGAGALGMHPGMAPGVPVGSAPPYGAGSVAPVVAPGAAAAAGARPVEGPMGSPGSFENAPPEVQSMFLTGGPNAASTSSDLPATRAPGSVTTAAPGSPIMQTANGPAPLVGPPAGNGLQTIFGVPMPPMLAMSALQSPDPAKAISQLMLDRRQRTLELLSQPNWNQGVTQLYQEGWMDPQHYQMLINHPETRQQVVAGLQDPNAYMATFAKLAGLGLTQNPSTGQLTISNAAIAAAGAKAAATAGATAAARLPFVAPTAAATAAGAAPYKTTTVELPDPNHPGAFVKTVVTQAQANQMAAANPGTVAAPTNAAAMYGGGNVSAEAYPQLVAMNENPGNVPAAGPGAAAGPSQFLPNVWSSIVSQVKPAWAEGMTPEQISAARLNPVYSAQMTYALAQQNGQALASVGVAPMTYALGLAHFLGAPAAETLFKAAPNAPLGTVLAPNVLKENGISPKESVGELIGQFVQKYGTGLVDLTTPFSKIDAGAVPGIAGPSSLPPQMKGPSAVTQSAITSDTATVGGLQADAASAQANQVQLLQAADLLPGTTTGAMAQARQAMQNYLATFGPNFVNKFTAAITAGNIDPTKAAGTQEFVKLAFGAAAAGMSATLRARPSAMGIEMYQAAYPNIGMQPTAIKDMLNVVAVMNQRTVDLGNQSAAYFNTQRDAYRASGLPTSYSSVSNFQAKFATTHSPPVYVAAAALLNGQPLRGVAAGLTAKQVETAMRIAWRVNPAAPLSSGRHTYYNPALTAGAPAPGAAAPTAPPSPAGVPGAAPASVP